MRSPLEVPIKERVMLACSSGSGRLHGTEQRLHAFDRERIDDIVGAEPALPRDIHAERHVGECLNAMGVGIDAELHALQFRVAEESPVQFEPMWARIDLNNRLVCRICYTYL